MLLGVTDVNQQKSGRSIGAPAESGVARLRGSRRFPPADTHSLHQHNLSLILRALAETGPASRSALSAKTGLARATVYNLIDELLELRLVDEAAGKSRQVGRPGTVVAIASQGPCSIGIDLKVHYIRVCAVDLAGRVRVRDVSFADNRGASLGEVVARVALLIRHVEDRARADGLRPVRYGLALPGITDPETGVLRRSPNLGWADIDVRAALAQLLSRRPAAISVDSGANLEALAEQHHGAGRLYRDFVLVSGEVGIGSGIVIDGAIHRGRAGAAGELGHVPVRTGGPACPCGNRGCLERFAGADAIFDAAGIPASDPVRAHPDDALSVLVGRASDGNHRARAAIERAGRYLGVALGVLGNVLAPDAVILSGIFVPLAPWLIPPLRPEMERTLVEGTAPAIALSSFGADAAAIGAATLGVIEMIGDPAQISAAP